MSSGDQLDLYQRALLHLGERKLASLTENVPARRHLDSAYNGGASVLACLENGQWNYATRPSAFVYSPSVEPAFGYSRAFNKPTDWVRTTAVSYDGYFENRLERYLDAAAFWFSDLDTIYVKYVSKDVNYGLDISKWPESFINTNALYLAKMSCIRITGDKAKKEDIERDYVIACEHADGIDGSNKPTILLPSGTWLDARRGNALASRRGWGER